MELAHFRQGPEAVDMIEQAVNKFNDALDIDPRRHDALWCLGNALTSQGFLYEDASRAAEFFDQAKDCFMRALAEDPSSDIYKKALEMTDKAPGLHAELQRSLREQADQQRAAQYGGGGGSNAAGGEGGGKQKEDEFWFEVGGWIIFGVMGLSLMVMQSSSS